MYRKIFLVALFTFGLAQLSQSQEPTETETISPDRPGFGDAVSVMSAGKFQLETGFQWEQSNFSAIFNTDISLNSTLFRYGINERIEARLDYNIVRSSQRIGTTFMNSEEIVSYAGLAPLRLGMKANILKNKGIVPELTFIGMLGMPWTASTNFRPNGVSPDLQLSFSNSINELLTICYNLGLSWNGNDPNPQNYYALSAEFSFNDKFGAYLQGRGSTQKIYNVNSSTYFTSLYTETGLMFYPKKHIQIDISGGLKVKELFSSSVTSLNSTYFFATAGLSWRFGDKI
jgi:Putative MetA-pathway of phenol degradation